MKRVILALTTFIFISCSNQPLPLAEYEGLYEYGDNGSLIIVAGPECINLYAVINEARYPLRPSKRDIF